GEFRRLVTSDPGRAADASADRGDLEDEPRALRAEDGDGGTGDVVDAPEIGLELLPEVLDRAGFDGCDVGIAGVVDEDVDAAEASDRVGECLLHLRWIGDVQLEREHAFAELGDEGVELSWCTCGGCDAMTCSQGGAGDRVSDAAGGSGDEPCLFHGFSTTPFY